MEESRAGERPDDGQAPTQRAGSQSGSSSFVITLWLEPQKAKAEPEWRWRVVHTQTGRQSHFHRLNDVLAFIAGESGVSAPQ